MAIRRVILTERELTRLIKRIVEETQDEMQNEMDHEMGEGWLGDKFSDMKKGGKKFFTGHESGEDKDSKMNQIMSDLDELEAEFEEDPDSFHSRQSNFDKVRKRLEKEAEDNNYRGEIVVRDTPNGKVVKYKATSSGFEDMASNLGASRRSYQSKGKY
jgi:flagellar motor protein MotB